MRQSLWYSPVALSTAEHTIIKRIRRAKLFVFLWQHRHALCADTLQGDLPKFYKDQAKGPPSRLLPNWSWQPRSKPKRRSPMTT